ncbi:MAG TPA: flavodoxin [Nocardioides bacterium]|uniref:flavodoxin family protein n=1 Tax=uncultured Nocardioides sp. TaxID=198441 RepID=UPI000EC011FC|nr:hypothetical protein [uncultured Nocardioides sp.]HCB06716.1 flavodoxin [Nocardioides sp.]HRD60111.1 hypothetical protein [Nocardioides sp.]HRK48628.1 hypothetical protein [Nocardioides sp.]
MTVTPRLRALVVYESMFGNTAKVADAVARGLRLEDVDAGAVEVGAAPTRLPTGIDLLVVGAPTHAFSLSRPSTREDAVRQGAPSECAPLGLREWLESVRLDDAALPDLAAFDTRVTRVRWLPRSAAPTAAKLGRRRHLTIVSKPIGFLVEGLQGPLVDGELERAVAWGRRIGATSVERSAVAG